MAKRRHPNDAESQPAGSEPLVAAVGIAGPAPVVQPIPGLHQITGMNAEAPRLRKYEITVSMAKPPYEYKEIVTATGPQAAEDRVVELFSVGVKVQTGKYVVYNGPSVIEQIRYCEV